MPYKKYSPETIHQRFWRHVNKKGPIPKTFPELGRCWIWIGAKHRQGYGLACFEHGMLVAHRVSFFIRNGRFPKDKLLHRCDNPPCIRPEHLEEGSQRKNVFDAIERGRFPQSKLTPEMVLEIRDCYREKRQTVKALARKFGVHRNTIWNVISRNNWSHI